MMRRLTPMHRDFGFDRGRPVDRHYIKGFVKSQKADITGEVIEAGGEPNYTRQFGGDRVTRSHILSPPPGGPDATLIGDLETGEGIPQQAFACAILTQFSGSSTTCPPPRGTGIQC